MAITVTAVASVIPVLIFPFPPRSPLAPCARARSIRIHPNN